MGRGSMGRRFNSPEDFDLDTHVDLAYTGGIVSADGQAQEFTNIVDTRDAVILDFTAAEAATSEPRDSLVKEVTVEEIVNYIGVAGSVRQNRVLVSIFGGIQWKLLGGVYYPVADYIAGGTQGTVLYRIPAKRGYHFTVCCDVSPYVQGTVDAVKFIYGYLPDERERVFSRE